MSYARPQHEDIFVVKYLQREIQALGIDPGMQQKFINFASKEANANASKFKARLYHVINGRTPSAYIALLLVDFFKKRKYEEVVRKTVDHVEYITPDGKMDELQKFVLEHPLQLRILKVKLWKNVEDREVCVVLRTPIGVPDWSKLDEDEACKRANAGYSEFKDWLNSQGPLASKIVLNDKASVDVKYEPEFLEPAFVGEWDFEERSNLSGTVDIGDGIDLMLLCRLKDKAPCIHPEGLDLFYDLVEVLGRDWAGKSATNYAAKQLWQKLAEHASCLPRVFFQEQQYFTPTTTTALARLFEAIARQHKKLADRALKDSAEMDRLGDSYQAKPEVFQLYDDARRDYANALLPVVTSNKKQIVDALHRVMEIYNERAQEHFAKLRGAFDTTSVSG